MRRGRGKMRANREIAGCCVRLVTPLNRHFYQYEPPRDLTEIDADLGVLSAEIMEMLREVHL